MNYTDTGWKRLAATGAVLAISAAASVYVVRAMRDHQRQRELTDGGRRGPTAGRPLTLIRGGAGEG